MPSLTGGHGLGLKAGTRNMLKILAAFQFTIGLLFITIPAERVAAEQGYSYVDIVHKRALWYGISLFISGITGMFAAYTNTAGLITLTIVMNVICSISLWVIGGFVSTVITSLERKSMCYSIFYNDYYDGADCTGYSLRINYTSGDAVMVLIAISQSAAALWCSILGCKVSCRSVCKNNCSCCNNCCNEYGHQLGHYEASQSAEPGSIIIVERCGEVGCHSGRTMLSPPGCTSGQRVIWAHPMAAYGQQTYFFDTAGAATPAAYAAAKTPGNAILAGLRINDPSGTCKQPLMN